MTRDLSSLKREARHKSTSVGRLLELAALDPQLSRTVAKSKYAPATILEHLSRSGDMPTRRAVAANPITPLGLLEKLTRDQQWTVLKAVATNPSTSEHLLVLLASHKRDSVRQSLFVRAALPAVVLEALMHFGNIEDQRRLALLPLLPTKLSEALSQTSDLETRCNLAWVEAKGKGKNLSQVLLSECAQAEQPEWRHLAAKFLDSPLLLTNLLTDPQLEVQAAAARNPHAATDALVQLIRQVLADAALGSQNQSVLEALLFNPTTPQTWRPQLREYVDDTLKNLSIKQETRLSHSKA